VVPLLDAARSLAAAAAAVVKQQPNCSIHFMLTVGEKILNPFSVIIINNIEHG